MVPALINVARQRSTSSPGRTFLCRCTFLYQVVHIRAYHLVHPNAKGGFMKGLDVAMLLVLGSVIWVLGTIHYAKDGPAILETTNARYWREFAISPLISAVLCIVILRWRNIPPAQWTSAM